MTIDDDKSIYVGGLPYDATESDLRRVFSLYGAVVAIKIVNDHEIGGKCYGFVTFTNPRSAVDAISDMNGRTIGGRVVRVNEVRPRDARPNFQRENFRRDAGRDADWDRERDRDREYARDRERYRDGDFERLRDRDRDRERDHDHGSDFDQTRDHDVDQSQDKEDYDQDHTRDCDHDWERDRNIHYDRAMGDVHDATRDKDRQSKYRFRAHSEDHHSREQLSSSSGKHNDEIKEKLEISIHRRDELQRELDLLDDKVEEKEQLVSDLHKKSLKLEDAVAAAKKLSSQRQSLLNKLHKGFLQVQECTKRLKSSEQELWVLVETAVSDVRMGEVAGARDGVTYVNG